MTYYFSLIYRISENINFIFLNLYIIFLNYLRVQKHELYANVFDVYQKYGLSNGYKYLIIIIIISVTDKSSVVVFLKLKHARQTRMLSI